MTSENLVLFGLKGDSKEEVIRALVEALDGDGILSSKEKFYNAVMQREETSPTGLEAGLAIPHGKSPVVKEAKFAVARLEKPIPDWASIDPNNRVDLVFLLAIPENEAGSTHLRLLSEISVRLMDPDYLQRLKAAQNASEFLAALEYVKPDAPKEQPKYSKRILAITACAAGIAHTYMAAEALEKAGREMGIEVLVEKQGANGIEGKHDAKQIREADGVIFATDIAPKFTERYQGMPYVQTKVAEPLKRAKEMLEQVLNNPDGHVQGSVTQTSEETKEKKGFWSELSQAILTGISYMIPVIVAAGLMIGIAELGSMPFGLVQVIGNAQYANSPNEIIKLLHFLDLYGNMIFDFMYPVFAAFVAYAIADRPGLVSGFIGGAFAAGLHFTIWGTKGVPSGFLGALVLGLVAGYVSKFLNEKIKVHKNLQAIKPMLIIPGVSVLVIFLLNFFVVDPVFGAINEWLQNTIGSAPSSEKDLLASIIAAATAFDLGGPINKAAGTIAIGLAADHIFPLTARVLSIVIPPIGVGLATLIDRFVVGRRVFDEDLRVAGTTSLLLGFIAISEGAIPFMLRSPIITIPINIIGAILGSVTAITFGAVQWYPLPAIWGWPLVQHLWAYLLGLAVGVLFIAFANIFVRFALIKRKERNA
ncbi:fructose-specific PTS transporter subunit EIIC [Alicyclobacillus fastidiosus]|uniref:Fructose-specific PTS transporter subunit EIIC n=2 Tax=Alicyclobacillus fastidiosus TaxID=392011 RepID=A0ABV5AJV9_9BACL|nr:fructose-specific PTS transporter subunit EIIC [Alicyclobacillus fastidiosus]WEH09117.1 fructose-specific PTS transporter subunit EIIC [Alicyclobacillus fastidiosus]